MNPEELQRAAVNTLYRRVAVSHLVLTFAGTTLAHRFALRRCGTESDVIYHPLIITDTLFCGVLIFIAACVYTVFWALVSRRIVPVPPRDEISDKTYDEISVVRRLAIAQERGRRASAIAAQINVFFVGVFSDLIGFALYLFLAWQGVLPT